MTHNATGDRRDGGTECGLSQIAAFASLDPETLAELNRICRVRSYRAGQIVSDAGEETRFAGCVSSGVLRMQKTLYDGRTHVVGLLVEGDMFGRVFDGPSQIAIEAATDVTLCLFPRGPFESLLLRYPDLDRTVLLNILSELDRARDWMVVLAHPKVMGRLAGFLLILCTRFAAIRHMLRRVEGALQVKIPISRADLAHLLGARPESISRAFHALEDTGCIRLERPDLIEIRDVDRLGTEAGEEESDTLISVKRLIESLREDRG